MFLKNIIKFLQRISKWLKTTYLIKTDPIKYARRIGVSIGDNCKLGYLNVGTFGTEPYLIKLGNHVELASGVRFITHDGAVWVFRENEPNIDVIDRIEIGNNVFVGMSTIILPGVTIGDNVIIGAGSVVTKDITSDTVAAGVPAKPISTIAEYRSKISNRSVFIRDLSIESKENYLKNRFNID